MQTCILLVTALCKAFLFPEKFVEDCERLCSLLKGNYGEAVKHAQWNRQWNYEGIYEKQHALALKALLALRVYTTVALLTPVGSRPATRMVQFMGRKPALRAALAAAVGTHDFTGIKAAAPRGSIVSISPRGIRTLQAF